MSGKSKARFPPDLGIRQIEGAVSSSDGNRRQSTSFRADGGGKSNVELGLLPPRAAREKKCGFQPPTSQPLP